jgi:hypothetical protein
LLHAQTHPYRGSQEGPATAPLVRGYARFPLSRHCCECRQFVWTACSRTGKRDDRSNWEGSGALYHAFLDVKCFFWPISGLANGQFAGCLQVKFRFGENWNVLFKPESNPQTLPDSCLPNAATITLRVFKTAQVATERQTLTVVVPVQEEHARQ